MGEGILRIWPQTASAYASDLDWLVFAFTGMMVIFVLPVFVLLVVFSFRYRKGSNVPRDHRPRGSRNVELTWIALPFIGAMVVYVASARLYYYVRTPPQDALEIQVVAKQWMWKFQHPDGQREINTLHVPVDRPVRLNMISQDVIHSLYFPALRVKQDVLPARYTQLWFEASETGVFDTYCAEYCGTDHSRMLARLVIQPADEYQAWLAQAGETESLASEGELLFRQFGCSGCHGPANVAHAPPLAGLYGRTVQLTDGSEVIADQAYLRDSILLPHKQIVAGFEPIMPSFANVLDEEAVLRLLAYLRTLDANDAGQPMEPDNPARGVLRSKRGE